MPGEKFADNYRQLVALRRGAMEHASVCEVGGVAPLRVLSALLLFKRTLASRDTEELHVE